MNAFRFPSQNVLVSNHLLWMKLLKLLRFSYARHTQSINVHKLKLKLETKHVLLNGMYPTATTTIKNSM